MLEKVGEGRMEDNTGEFFCLAKGYGLASISGQAVFMELGQETRLVPTTGGPDHQLAGGYQLKVFGFVVYLLQEPQNEFSCKLLYANHDVYAFDTINYLFSS